MARCNPSSWEHGTWKEECILSHGDCQEVLMQKRLWQSWEHFKGSVYSRFLLPRKLNDVCGFKRHTAAGCQPHLSESIWLVNLVLSLTGWSLGSWLEWPLTSKTRVSLVGWTGDPMVWRGWWTSTWYSKCYRSLLLLLSHFLNVTGSRVNSKWWRFHCLHFLPGKYIQRNCHH